MIRKKYKRKKRGPVQAKKISYDGINFASGLERYMYMALKKAKIRAKYEGDYKNRGAKRILPIKYTPDFIGDGFIIETKGRANESFPMRWKLFKLLVTQQFPDTVLYKPQNQVECDRTIQLILEKQRK